MEIVPNSSCYRETYHSTQLWSANPLWAQEGTCGPHDMQAPTSLDLCSQASYLCIDTMMCGHIMHAIAHLDCILLSRLKDGFALGDLQQAGGIHREMHAQLGRLAVLGLGIVNACKITPS